MSTLILDELEDAQLRDLPEGEKLVWRGAPAPGRFRNQIFALKWVGAYFLALIAWRVVDGLADGASWGAAIGAAVPLALMAAVFFMIVLVIAHVLRAGSWYAITNRRLIMQIGAALPITLNIPLEFVEGVAVNRRRDGSGDIAVELTKGQGFSYLMLWPHARPWRFKHPHPALRCLIDVDAAATELNLALEAMAAKAPAAEDLADPLPKTDADLAFGAAAAAGSLKKQKEESPIVSVHALYAAGAMAAAALVVAFTGSFAPEKVGATDVEKAVAARNLVFARTETGGFAIRDAAGGAPLMNLSKDESGVVENIIRGFDYHRRREGVDTQAPLTLLAFDQDNFALVDNATNTTFNFRGAGLIQSAHLDGLLDE